MGDYYSESGEEWSSGDEDEDYENTLLAPSNGQGQKVPPVAPPKPVKTGFQQEEEDDDEYEYYDDDEEEGEYEDEEYYDDDDEDGEDEGGEEEYEEYEEGDYEEEEGEEEEVEVGQQEEWEEEDEEEGDAGFGQEQQGEDDDDDDWFEDDDDDYEPEPQTQGFLGMMGNATSNAISAVRKSLGHNSPQMKGNGFVQPPSKEIVQEYQAAPIPIKIQRNPTPLEERIPKSMRAKNNKLDYSQIKGKLNKGAPTKRPLTGLHKPVHPKAGRGQSKRVSRPKSRKPAPGSRAPGLVKPTPAKFKGSKEAPQWVERKKKLKQTNRPLTGLHKPVGAKQMSGSASTSAVNGHVPSKGRRQQGLVKGEKPKFERNNKAPKLESQRRKLRKAPRERPLTGYYQPVGGKEGPRGEKTNEMVDGFVPKKKRPASRKPGRNHKEGVVKGARPTYKKKSGNSELSNARGKLKKGPTPRPLTGYYQPPAGKKMAEGATDDMVNSFVPKPKSRNKDRAAVKNI